MRNVGFGWTKFSQMYELWWANYVVCKQLLMIQGTKEWDEQRICHLLFEDDVEAVLKNRIPQIYMGDFPAWNYENNGFFTVKSAYKLAWSLSDLGVRNNASSSAPDGWEKNLGCLLEDWCTAENKKFRMEINAW